MVFSDTEGIHKTDYTGKIKKSILDIVNARMKIYSLTRFRELMELAPKTDESGRPRTVIVQQNSDSICRARINLKQSNSASGPNFRVVVN